MIGNTTTCKTLLPIEVVSVGGEIFIDLADFGATPLMASFFDDEVRRVRRQPVNRSRTRMALGDFLAASASEQSLTPSGFIFHMSRCGSTLVSQMLAASPANIAISEAAPIDAAVQSGSSEFLTAMVAAFGRRRSGAERHLVIKLDCWHTTALPLFRSAFPKVPWVFLYRDPVEVLVSHMIQPGSQMVPGTGGYGGASREEYSARVLARICQAALDHHAGGGGRMVNYRDLPEAIGAKIIPHFGMAFSAEERAAMDLAARYDAKAPGMEFARDSQAKQSRADGRVRALAQCHLGEIYGQLEDLALLT